jgi:hypothetical protein
LKNAEGRVFQIRKKGLVLFLFLVCIGLLAIIGASSFIQPLGDNNNEFIEPQPPDINYFSFIYENVTEEERTKAIDIAVNDPDVKEWLGKGYEIGTVVLYPYLRSVGEYSVSILTQEQMLPWVIGISLNVKVNATIEKVKSFSYELALASLNEEQKEEVLNIATAYIEENYGTDFTIDKVRVQSGEESIEGKNTFYAYPRARFRIPSSRSQEGIIAEVFVDLENGEITKVTTVHSSISLQERPPLDVDFDVWFPNKNVSAMMHNIRVGQGDSASTNMTLNSIYYEEDLTVSFSMEFGAYQNMPVASDDPSPFVAKFDPDPLILKYLEPRNVTITINADNDTPLGLYTMTIWWKDENIGTGMGATIHVTVVE